jgi:hypothetical protein
MDGVDDAKKIRAHNKLNTHLEAVRKATSHVEHAAPRTWHCDTCNEDMSADATVVNDHNTSDKHRRQLMWSAEEQNRDGQQLAQLTRVANGAAATGEQATTKKRSRNCK